MCDSLIDVMPGLCGKCWGKIDFISKPSCVICNFPFEFDLGNDILCGACTSKKPLFTESRSVFRYNDNSKTLLQDFKYRDKTHLAPYLSLLMYNIAGDILKDADLLIPVPLHKKRLLSRLYNQSSLLCAHLSKLSNIAFEPNGLIKHQNTKPQTGLSKKKRLKNVKNAFKINESKLNQIAGKNIILIDDVITTGATINACTKELLNNGKANKVSVISLARKIE